MCVQIYRKILVIFALLAVLGGCGAMDNILPSAGTYKVNARVNGVSLDEFSFISAGDEVLPYFEYSVADDPDVTGLMVYLKSAKGDIAGYKVIYGLDTVNVQPGDELDKEPEEGLENEPEKVPEKDDTPAAQAPVNEEGEIPDENEEIPALVEEYINGEEYFIRVENLDKILPFLPIPSNLPIGRYTLVCQVLGEDTILHRTEKSVYYLADANFTFDSIQVYLPFITENPQLVPKETVIMLETVLNFDSRLDPYVIWYNGKKVVGEGRYSTGEGTLLWKTPDQSGFFSLRAEVYPLVSQQDLLGYQKGISLLVSAKSVETNYLAEDASNLLNWYLFEGNLNDSKTSASEDRALKLTGRKSPLWMPFNGTYGIAAGPNDVYTLPKIISSGDAANSWQILSRFKPLSDGKILSVQFGSSVSETGLDVLLNLSKEKGNLVLSLASPMENFSKTYALPDTDSFIASAITFSMAPDRLSVNLEIIDGKNIKKAISGSIILEAELDHEFIITIGGKTAQTTTAALTALWEELAVFSVINEKQPEKANEVEEDLLVKEDAHESDAKSDTIS